MTYEELQKNSEHWYNKYKELKEENKQLKEKVEGYEITRDRLIAMGFPTFMSCKEYAEQINKMKCCGNCKGVCNSDDVAHFCKNNDYKLWEIRK